MDDLIGLGNISIYDSSKRQLECELQDKSDEKLANAEVLPRSKQSSDMEVLPRLKQSCDAEKQFRYKWSEDGDLYGPFGRQEMQEWQQSGYFSNGIWLEDESGQFQFTKEWKP